MKKTYQKPLLFAETFKLVEHVAGDCTGFNGSYQTNSANIWMCMLTDGDGSTVFISDTNACGDADTQFDYNDIDRDLQCYNVFIEGSRIYGS